MIIYHRMPDRMAKTRTPAILSAGKNAEQLEAYMWLVEMRAGHSVCCAFTMCSGRAAPG